jgi:hypothetical protein
MLFELSHGHELVEQAGREREAVLKEGREDPVVLLG